jgi:hypothetical protein
VVTGAMAGSLSLVGLGVNSFIGRCFLARVNISMVSVGLDCRIWVFTRVSGQMSRFSPALRVV